ncbi:MAG: DUF6448 family protein [Eubacteriales bacterium]|nr:DUF6448 family protein [Eubacteriales bacterium]
MVLTVFSIALALIVLAVLVKPACAKAHCDTMDGPTVKDGIKALETGNINHAYKWIEPAYESELKEIFDKSRKVRTLGPDARELADRVFLENLVRIHRAGEGEGFTGLKPHGVPMDEKVAAADKSIETSSLAPMTGLFAPHEMHALENKFHAAIALKGYDPDDVPAARKYIAAYVDFFKLAEGEEHAPGGHAAHAAGSHHQEHGSH